MRRIHPLVRDLYKRALTIGSDYPLGLPYVRKTWKSALKSPTSKGFMGNNLPKPFYVPGKGYDEKLIMAAVARGRYFLKEMVGVIQLKKYRALKERYGDEGKNFDDISRGLEEKWKEES
ncbi:hypothetical protein TrVE_jg9145 [Triparma verrucosa]|uniref:Uncharacterized protein n=2 Tax=Triparma TaxID=722752 RepID=A0A9W7AUP4_9STRA|nr:hypothetical protein TrST_g5086 [Triparma strigata]GMH95464.1 hypothetical protein TrVE_jg9145 [Triparma verrucosa]